MRCFQLFSPGPDCAGATFQSSRVYGFLSVNNNANLRGARTDAGLQSESRGALPLSLALALGSWTEPGALEPWSGSYVYLLL
ncbi:uncharacterized protein UV8b_05131 [Ustilaginoidea virens]|uniref:Uncharacterized protein n=1 Tax=Ustilaginoidea virens TaxID=1159556 RepID=A0A8E5HSL7_USTVR|nr:uncharacterized protein UV8b_05131 [Ustilaginoidea virens]QUC20890.1 hypothetical protein UV8b_05131 [Ustilaginoidea virens]